MVRTARQAGHDIVTNRPSASASIAVWPQSKQRVTVSGLWGGRAEPGRVESAAYGAFRWKANGITVADGRPPWPAAVSPRRLIRSVPRGVERRRCGFPARPPADPARRPVILRHGGPASG